MHEPITLESERCGVCGELVGTPGPCPGKPVSEVGRLFFQMLSAQRQLIRVAEAVGARCGDDGLDSEGDNLADSILRKIAKLRERESERDRKLIAAEMVMNNEWGGLRRLLDLWGVEAMR